MSGSTSGERLVKPGYHLKPKYDLHGLRRRRNNDGAGHVAGELPLTSMIDMFSILVIYLLMNFSATGEMFFLNKNLPLPHAATTNPLATGPLLSLVGDNFVLDAPPDWGSIPAVEDNSPNLTQITAGLNELKNIAQEKNIDTHNRVNIQAGEDMHLGEVKRAMAAAVQAGWTNINFVVEKKH
jgi:biopolymer transport protein ExbD